MFRKLREQIVISRWTTYHHNVVVNGSVVGCVSTRDDDVDRSQVKLKSIRFLNLLKKHRKKTMVIWFQPIKTMWLLLRAQP